jgi:hypothetical protein
MSLSPEALAAALTMNKPLLGQIPLADMLAIHPIFEARKLEPYVQVQKTKTIRAKPGSSLCSDKEGPDVFLINTLEANEGFDPNSWVCRGEGGDVWPQADDKLKGKYTCVDHELDGWSVWEPKPENPFNGHQMTDADGTFGPNGGFCIINGYWGQAREVSKEEEKMLADLGIEVIRVAEGKNAGKVCFHYGLKNDWVLQNPTDRIDTYRVKIGFFQATYAVKD